MKFDLENALKTLGWPLGLTAVFSSVLLLFGYIVQVAGTQQVHRFITQGLGVWRFSYTARQLLAFRDA